MAEKLQCRLLSRQWRDGPRGVDITLWGVSAEGPVKANLETEAVMFVPRTTAAALTADARRVPVELVSPSGDEVDALYFASQRALIEARTRLRTVRAAVFESDLKPSDRYVMERFITGAFEISGRVTRRPAPGENGVIVVQGGRVRSLERAPDVALSVCSFDLETDGPDGALLSYALVHRGKDASAPRVERVVVAGDGAPDPTLPALSFVRDETALLASFLAALGELDPDVLVGWNVVEFDLRVLETRCQARAVPFLAGRNGERGRVIPGERGQLSIARIPGRVVLDGIGMLKNATWSFERYTLEHVSRALLGRGKLSSELSNERLPKQAKIDEIRRMAREDPRALALYNLEDARLVADIFDAADLLGFATARADLVGLPLERQGGSVAAFDHLYLPRLHRAGVVAFDVEHEAFVEPSPGGEVLEGVPGLHRDVLAFDFRSLYPSIIRTFRVDPLGLYLATLAPRDDGTQLAGFDGARFTKTPSILPDLIERLTLARKEALATGNEALSRAIKVQMASFYGVLGTPGCRFFDSRLASSITRRGHQIIRRSRIFFEERGYGVLYGDTDSLFVDVRGAAEGAALIDLGRALAAELNETLRSAIAAEHQLQSALEMRFDLLFTRFLMPKVRSGDAGSKKRYAGLVVEPSRLDAPPRLVVKGLEAVRTDWTPFARRIQRELLERVFADQPWDEWLRQVRSELVEGGFDAELVYRKRLRRGLDQYAAAPPHVRAARLANEAAPGDDASGREDIEYVVTREGPLPAPTTARIDYDHYIDKQLAPVCDVVLTVLGSSFERIAGTQLDLVGG